MEFCQFILKLKLCDQLKYIHYRIEKELKKIHISKPNFRS